MLIQELDALVRVKLLNEGSRFQVELSNLMTAKETMIVSRRMEMVLLRVSG